MIVRYTFISLITFLQLIPRCSPEYGAGITVITENSTQQDGQFTNDRYGNVLGVIDWDGQTRVYFQNRGKGRAEYSESQNLTDWTEPVAVEMDQSMFLFTDNQEIRCYQDEENGNLILYSDFDPVEGCTQRDRVAYTWKLDGQVSMNVFNGIYVSTGRVRGTRLKREGGWGRDLPPYPSEESYPEIEEAFKPYLYYDAEEYLKDRRGISIHKSENGEQWESAILADPTDMDIPGFKGWRNKDFEGIADFYASTLVDDKRILLKVYWKDKNRLIDRSDYSDQFRDDVRRRYRFTGETTIIPGVISNEELQITSTESVIPLERFNRVVSDDVHWATAPEREEVGQFSLANRVIERDNFVYLFFQYRDDVHYEFHESMKYSGIFVYKMKKAEFDTFFIE